MIFLFLFFFFEQLEVYHARSSLKRGGPYRWGHRLSPCRRDPSRRTPNFRAPRPPADEGLARLSSSSERPTDTAALSRPSESSKPGCVEHRRSGGVPKRAHLFLVSRTALMPPHAAHGDGPRKEKESLPQCLCGESRIRPQALESSNPSQSIDVRGGVAKGAFFF